MRRIGYWVPVVSLINLSTKRIGLNWVFGLILLLTSYHTTAWGQARIGGTDSAIEKTSLHDHENDHHHTHKHSASEENQVIVELETYFASKYLRNGYLESFRQKWTGTAEQYVYVENELNNIFTKHQMAFLTSCLKKNSVSGKEINTHEQQTKTLIQSRFDQLIQDLKNPNSVVSTFEDHNNDPFQLPAQPTYCENMDIEACDFSNWTTESGRVNNTPYGFINRVLETSFHNGAPVRNGMQHSIVSTQGQDATVPVQMIKPGGTCSAVLGDATGTGKKASAMKRAFEVTNDNFNFFYSYSVVMQNPTNVHTPGERPYFTVRMWDQSGNRINCADFEVYSGDGNPAWKTRPGGGTPVVYTDWTEAYIPLQAYVGQTVTIEFATGDCDLGGHWAYAYVEAHCGGEITVTDTVTCPGVPITITAPDGASAYSWSNGETTRSIQTEKPGLYTVTMTGTAGGNCTSSMSTRIYLKDAPVANFTADTVCLNAATTFTDRSVKATTGFKSWNWDFGANGSTESTTQNPQYTFSSSGNHSVNLQIEDVNGCLHDTTFQAFVAELPNADFNVNTVCEGDSTSFTNNSTGHTKQTWDFLNNGSSTSNTNNPKYEYNSFSNIKAKLIVETNYGCLDSVTKDVDFNVAPTAMFTHQDVCSPNNINFTDGSTPIGAISAWDWQFNNGATSGNQNPQFAFSSAGEYKVLLKVTSTDGCIDTVSKKVNYLEKPKVDFALSDTCRNEAFQLVNKSTLSTGTFASWSWDIENNGITNYTTKDASHTFSIVGNYNIQLIGETDKGCKDTVVKSVTIHPLPIADFAASSVCLNDTSKITDLTSGNISKWEWDFLNDGTVNGTQQNPSTVFSSHGLHPVKLRVTTNQGCLDSIVKNANVNPLPDAQFNTKDICFPEPMNFTNASTVSSGRVSQFRWTFGDGSVADTNRNTSHSYTGYGTFTTRLNIVSDSGCVDSITKDVEVFEKPQAAFTSIDTCIFDKVNFVDETQLATGIITNWEWDIMNNGSKDYLSQNPTHIFSNDGKHAVRLIATSNNNCKDTIVDSVRAYPLPTAEFARNNVCFNDSVGFLDLSLANNGVIQNWDWKFGDGTTSNQTSPKHFYGKEGIYNVELVISTDFNCRDTIKHSVNIWPLPSPDFIADAVCLEETMEFVDASTISSLHTNNDISQYNWNFGDGSISTNPEPKHTYIKDGSFDVTLVAKSNRGCIDTITKTIKVNPLPNVSFTSSNPEGCSEWCVDFVNTSTVRNGSIKTTVWDFSDGQSEDKMNPSVCFTNDSLTQRFFDVQLTVVSNLGCKKDSTWSKYVTVNPITKADFTFLPEITDENIPTYSFTNTSVGASVFNWEFGDGDSSYFRDPEHTYPGAGTYDVTLSVNNKYDCPSEITKPVEIIPVYTYFVPNTFTPDGDGLNDDFGFKTYNVTEFEMYIFDRWGEQIFASNHVDQKWDGTYRGNTVQIDVYVYKALLTDIFGKKHEVVGHVTVLK